MKKAQEFLESVSEAEYIDFGEVRHVSLGDAMHAIKLAYNEGIEAVREKMKDNATFLGLYRDIKNLKK